MTAVTAVPPEVRAAFDEHLAHADEAGATALALDLLRNGTAAEDVLLGLIAPAQSAVGGRWVSTEWSVAQEHAATHVSERVVSAVAAAAAPSEHRGDASGRRAAFVCAEGERHTLPARIAAEVLRLRGLDLAFLGTGVPGGNLVAYIHREGPDLVAVSCMIPVRLPAAHRLIRACQGAGVPVLAGGRGFGPGGVWARTLGADLCAPDPVAAAALLAGGWPGAPREAAALAHLADEEYARIIAQRPELLQLLLAALCERFPRLCDPDAEYAEAVREEIGRLPDVVAAANYVDDPRVLTDYLAFAAHFVQARGVPTTAVGAALGALSGPLHALPRAAAHLAAGQRWLAGPGAPPPTV